MYLGYYGAAKILYFSRDILNVVDFLAIILPILTYFFAYLGDIKNLKVESLSQFIILSTINILFNSLNAIIIHIIESSMPRL